MVVMRKYMIKDWKLLKRTKKNIALYNKPKVNIHLIIIIKKKERKEKKQSIAILKKR